MHQHNFVEARVLANGTGRSIHRPCQHRGAANRNVLRLEGVASLAVNCNEEIIFLRALARRLRQSGHARKIKPQHRYGREKAAPGRRFDTKAVAPMTCPLPCPAHRLAPRWGKLELGPSMAHCCDCGLIASITDAGTRGFPQSVVKPDGRETASHPPMTTRSALWTEPPRARNGARNDGLGALAIVQPLSCFSRRVSKPGGLVGRLLEQYGEHPDKKGHPDISKQCFRCRNKSRIHGGANVSITERGPRDDRKIETRYRFSHQFLTIDQTEVCIRNRI